MKTSFEEAREAIQSLSHQVQKENLILEGPRPRRNPSAIILCGMGGSGISGDIIRDLSEYAGIRVPIMVHKNYGIPIIPEAAYIFVSFSGETAETLDAFQKALKKCPKGNIAVATGGGKLLEKARKNNVFLGIFNGKNLTPREGVGYTTNAVFSLLCSFIPTARDIRPLLFSSIPHKQYAAFARQLARDMSGRNALIYTDNDFSSVGKAWKMYFNESGKKLTFTNIIPEANHNEIEALIKKSGKNYTAIFIENPDAGKEIKKRFAETRVLAKKAGMKVFQILLSGKSAPEKIGKGIALGAWGGFALAEKDKINPRETKIITAFKRVIGS